MSRLEKLKEYSTCDVSDALTSLGIVGHLNDIKAFTDFKVVGLAHTVEFTRAGSSGSPNYRTTSNISSSSATSTSKHHVDVAPKDSIIVIKANFPNAVWGGLMTMRSKVIGVQGVVIQGRFRDFQEIKDLEFPVWATGQSTMGAGSLQKQLKEIEIDNVKINSDCIVIADIDGVVTFDKSLLDQVLDLCQSRVEMDSKCMNDVKNGVSLADAFAKHRK